LHRNKIIGGLQYSKTSYCLALKDKLFSNSLFSVYCSVMVESGNITCDSPLMRIKEFSDMRHSRLAIVFIVLSE
jgi:hypothetical protein